MLQGQRQQAHREQGRRGAGSSGARSSGARSSGQGRRPACSRPMAPILGGASRAQREVVGATACSSVLRPLDLACPASHRATGGRAGTATAGVRAGRRQRGRRRRTATRSRSSALVTGGAAGPGEATLQPWSGQAATVVIADLFDDRAGALARELGDSAVEVGSSTVRAMQRSWQRSGRRSRSSRAAPATPCASRQR